MSKKRIPKPDIKSDVGIPHDPIFDPDDEPAISFSFNYWKQIDSFGLDRSEPKWFVSLIECLSDTTELRRSDLESNYGLKNRFRYHPIDWDTKNIPIQRSDLEWLPQEIRENDEEFPIYQISVTTGNGRIAGFWGPKGEETVFYIILLDPKHNLQPSENYNFNVDPCAFLENEYADLERRSDNLIKHVNDNCSGCSAIQIAQEFQNHDQERAIVSFLPTDYNQVMEVIDREDIDENSIDDIVFRGLYHILEENN